MKKTVAMITVMIGLQAIVSGQSTFIKTYCDLKYYGNESFCTVRQTSDSGFIIAANTLSKHLLIKTSVLGDTVWTAGITNVFLSDIKQTTDGGFIISGIMPTVDSSGNPNNKFCLIKTNAVGNFLWNKVFSNPFFYYLASFKIVQTLDGGYFLAGSNNYGFCDLIWLKTDSAGNQQWTGRVFDGGSTLVGDVIQTMDSGYVIASTLYLPAPANYGFARKIDPQGVQLWDKEFHAASGYSSKINSVKETVAGDLIFAGDLYYWSVYPNTPNLVKTDAAGDTAWNKSFDCLDSTNTYQLGSFACAIPTPDGGVIACGNNTVVKTDSTGSLQWAKHYLVGSSMTELFSIDMTFDGGYFLTGAFVDSAPGAGLQNYRLLLLKVDGNGYSGCNYSTFTPVESCHPVILANVSVTNNPYPITDSAAILFNAPADSVSPYTFCQALSVPETTHRGTINIFPNPASGDFTVSFNDQAYIGRKLLEIYDLAGKLVYQEVLPPGNFYPRHHACAPGIYLLKVTAGNYVFNGKLIIQ